MRNSGGEFEPLERSDLRRAGSGGQPQRQRGHGQEEEHGRRAERVVACTQVGDDGTDEEHDDADCGGRPDGGGGCGDGCGGRPDQWHADANQQSERAGSFQGGQRGQPRFRHIRPGHGGEDPVIAGEVGRDRKGEVGDEQGPDNDVSGEHGEPFSSTGIVSPGTLPSVLEKVWRTYHMQKIPTSGPGATRRRRRLTRAIQESLRELSNQLSLLNHHVSAHIDLNDTDLDCLELINRHGPLNPSALARRAGLHPATITGILDRLERGGWVARERDPSDRRAVVVRALRDRSAELFRLYAGMNTAMDQLCASYGDEELQLLADFLHRTTNAGRTATDQLASD